MKNKDCPQCNYPMDEVILRKGGTYKKRIANFECGCCGHKERIGDDYEYARACKKTRYEID